MLQTRMADAYGSRTRIRIDGQASLGAGPLPISVLLILQRWRVAAPSWQLPQHPNPSEPPLSYVLKPSHITAARIRHSMLTSLARGPARLAARRLKSTVLAPPIRVRGNIVVVHPRTTAAPASTILIDLPDRPSMTPSAMLDMGAELGKSRLSGFVAMTGAMGYAATGAPLLAPGFALATLGVFGTSCAANALNQLRETDRDALMTRTRKRPLPSGRCSPQFAATFAGVSGGAGTAALAVLDPTAAALAVGNLALYAGAYTYLKPKSEVNTWVGAVVGGVPPLIGWAAAGGSLWGPESPMHENALQSLDMTWLASLSSTISATPAEPWLLAGALYLWQFPHFFALAWVHRTDYKRGDYQMVPVNDPTGSRTANLILRYSLYSTAFPFAAVSMGAASPMFAVEGLVLNAALVAASIKFRRKRTTENARTVFRITLAYLPLLLFFLLLHSERLTRDSNGKPMKEPTLGDAMRPLNDLGRMLCLHELGIGAHDAAAPTFCPVDTGGKKDVPGTRR